MDLIVDHNDFASLNNVCQLVQHLSEVTLSYVSKTITDDNFIQLKNLLIDNYIQQLDTTDRSFMSTKRSQFKDWLSEQLWLHVTSVTLKTDVLPKQSHQPRASLLLPTILTIQDPENNAVRTDIATNRCNSATRTTKHAYCTEVMKFTFTDDETLPFHTAATMFNRKFKCRVFPNCKIIAKERSRNNITYSTQNYKCNCCTSDVVLQLRRYNSVLRSDTTTNICVVSIFIKHKMSTLFHDHFLPIT